MYSLLIDTHYQNVTLALYENEKLVNLINKSNSIHHSEITMPLIVGLLKNEEIDVNDIKEIISVIGPGSFTGVRIGVVIAKTLAFTLNIPIKTLTSIDMLYASNDCKQGTYAIEEKNGYFINEYNSEASSDNVCYLSKKDFQERYTVDDVIMNVEYDFNKIYDFLKLKDIVNPHIVNPLYVKQIEVLK